MCDYCKRTESKVVTYANAFPPQGWKGRGLLTSETEWHIKHVCPVCVDAVKQASHTAQRVAVATRKSIGRAAGHVVESRDE